MPIAPPIAKNKTGPMLFSRVKEEDFDEAKRVAEEHFDGNLSILVRIAVKRMVSSFKASEDDSETKAKAA